MVKRVRGNRTVERAAVNTTRGFFEGHNFLFNEVDLVNDVGKDAYVDIVSSRRDVTALCFAVQIKGGKQTVRVSSSVATYGIPYTKEDATLYRSSNLPIFGIAHDSTSDGLYWVDLKAHCMERWEAGQAGGGFAPAEGSLSDDTLAEFVTRVEAAVKNSQSSASFDLLSDDEDRQVGAVLDALALGRTDHRPLLMVRRLFGDMRGEAVLAAAWVLSHVCWVPDRMYSSRNWLAPEVKARVVRELSWSSDELRTLLTAVQDDADMFGRGVIGQTVSALILQDGSAGSKLFAIARLKSADMTARRRAIVYLAYLTKDDDGARDIVSRLLRLAPDLLEDDAVLGIYEHVQEWGWINIYD
jgi:hypothetical protein